MKRILLTLTVLFISLTCFGQLNLDGFANNRWHETLEGALDILTNDNPNININDIRGYNNTLNDGRKIYLYVFTDNSGKFLDIMFFNKEPNKRYELNDARKLLWNRERYILGKVDTSMENIYKLLMSDNSIITIEFNYNEHNEYGKYTSDVYTLDYFSGSERWYVAYNYKKVN